MPSLLYRVRRRFQKTTEWFRGCFQVFCMLPIHKVLRIPVSNLNAFERRVAFIERFEYSQNGEDGIIHALFSLVGTTNKYYVEFGVEDGMQTNTRYLWKHKGWKGLLMDGGFRNSEINLQQEYITAENIEDLFRKYNVPSEFDLLSIDIDSNDYWVWKAITHYSPRVVIMEYNACFPWSESKTIAYNPEHSWDKTDYMGATLQALVKLGKEKGYTLVATDRNGVNAFFVRHDVLSPMITVHPPEKLYHPAKYKGKVGNKHPSDPLHREWVTI